MYEFTSQVEDLETFLMKELSLRLMLSGKTSDEVTYFQNGDKLTVDLKRRIAMFDLLEPARVTSSILNWKRHQWFGAGILQEVSESGT